jgi:uncharacterized beta-barrel protein YwiB (DUF1934 family)
MECRQPDSGEAPVITTAAGEYDSRNGKHYIRYASYTEDQKELVKNMIKIAPDRIEIMRRGAVCGVMVFDRSEPAQTAYKTPYGTLYFQICTTMMQVAVEEDIIRIDLCYTLSNDGGHISDYRVGIKVSIDNNDKVP